MFKLKSFQRHDLAAGALHSGFILAWATGLGKTIAMFLWPLLKVGLKIHAGHPPSSTLHSRSQKPSSIINPLSSRLVPAQPVLLVVPGDGHDQTDDESRKHFKTVATRLDSQATFLRLSTVNPHTGVGELPPGYYLTSYTQLSQNGVPEFPTLTLNPTHNLTLLGLSDRQVEQWWEARGEHGQDHYERLGGAAQGITADSSWHDLELAHLRLTTGRMEADRFWPDRAKEWLANVTPHLSPPSYASLSETQKDFCRTEVARRAHKEFSAGIGETREFESTPHASRFTIKCLYHPSLADLAQDCFGAIVVDEGTKIQGEETLISLGVRQINAPHRLVMSATPIKNRFPQVFRLAHYACGGHAAATARFPFGGAFSDREDFGEQFQVGETKLDPGKKKGRGRRKLTPQIANIHHAWKIFAPIILRRRKEDCGEDIVPKRRHVIRAPMGTLQAQVYDFHLRAEYQMTDARGRTRPNIGARLQALRIAAANPASALLQRPAGDDKTAGKVFSPYSYIPKVASALSVIEGVLKRREQIMIGSAFQNSLDALSERLCECHIPHLILDGRTSQKRRGELAAEFKRGSPRAVLEGLLEDRRLKIEARHPPSSTLHSRFPVLLAGVESMAELHSFPYCNNVGLLSYSWAYDKFEQFINRVHRINSPWPVDVWSIICEGSIDRVLEDNVHTKGDASDLVLDGHLLGENPQEVNLHELLNLAQRDFKRNAKTIDEPALEKNWPALRSALAAAYRGWSACGPTQIIAQRTPRIPTPPPTPIIAPDHATVKVDDLPLWRQRLRKGR